MLVVSRTACPLPNMVNRAARRCNFFHGKRKMMGGDRLSCGEFLNRTEGMRWKDTCFFMCFQSKRTWPGARLLEGGSIAACGKEKRSC